VARKVGFDEPGAAAWLGDLQVEGIGVPRALLEKAHGPTCGAADQPGGTMAESEGP